MKDTIELIIDGSKVESIYQDGLADLLDAEEVQVCRASNVEWEEVDGRKGWSVRAAHAPNLAIRTLTFWPFTRVVLNDQHYPVTLFQNREEALAAEVSHFWELIQGRNLNG
jgi:hypothetical protein